jgi:predicted DNA-binding transcriptional regulator AlpA
MNDFLSADEAARKLGISRTTLYQIIQTHGYTYTHLSPRSVRSSRGRKAWARTGEQFDAILWGPGGCHIDWVVRCGFSLVDRASHLTPPWTA